MPLDIEQALLVLSSEIRNLHHSGSAGFEGFIAASLAELTGQPYRLVKPGAPQGGTDMLSDADGNGLVVAVEAKRFQPGTALPLDELKAKVADAAQTYPEVELWVLAASRALHSNDRRALVQFAEPLGITVLILDTTPGPTGIPRLGVLLVSTPGAASRYFVGNAGYAAALQRLQQEPGLGQEVARLRGELLAADVGYAATQVALARWMRETMSEIGAAKADLGSHADILSSHTRGYVRRGAAEALLEAAVRDPTQARCLLGGEGVGKTWAVLAWWQANAGDDGRELPLTVWLSAAAAGRGTLVEMIADALHGRTRLRSPEFWKRRLERWQSGEATRLLVVIDGLNQNWMVRNWSSLLQPLFAREWRGKASVVLTCRPDHWEQELGGLRDLVPPPVACTLEGFDPAELDAMLERYGRTRSEFAPKMIDLMRIPRLFALAMRRGRELGSMAEPTPEALVLEDWKDRVRLRGNQVSLGHQEFVDLIARLGRRFKAALLDPAGGHLSRSELIQELGRESGYGRAELGGAVSELVDGRWLPREGAQRFRLDPSVVPVALGLTLLEALCPLADAPAIGEVIADFLDPLRGADIGVGILRAATTAALVETDTPAQVREALVLAWLTAQNFFAADFEAFWRLVGLDPDLFLDIAQAGWLAARFEPRHTEVLCKAFANASKWDSVGTAVDAMSLLWMSAVWCLPDETSIPHAQGHGAPAEQELLVRLDSFQQAHGKGVPGAAALHFEGGGDGWLRLSHEAVTIASFRPRARARDAFAAWALAAALMGPWYHLDRVAWVLRLNEEDPEEAEEAVLAVCGELAAVADPVARSAGSVLLGLLATKRAIDMLRRGGLTSHPASAREQEVAPASSRVPDIADFSRLARTAGLLTQRLDDQQVAALRTLCRTAPVADLMSAMMLERGGLLALVACWAPDEIAPLLRRAAASATAEPDGAEWLDQAIARSYAFAAFTDAEGRQQLVLAWRTRAERRRLTRSHVASPGCTPLELVGEPIGRQVEILLSLEALGASDQVRYVIEPFTTEVLCALAKHLTPDAPVAHLRFWLDLLSRAKLGDEPGDPSFLVDLAYHPDAAVRVRAMTALHEAFPPVAAVAFAARGWRWTPDTPADEAAWGSLLLLDAKPSVGADLLDRADPQIAPAAFAADPAEIDRLQSYLEGEIAYILAPKAAISSGRYRLIGRTLDAFVAERPEAAEHLVAPLLDKPDALSSALFFIFPIVPLCRGLLRHRPEAGLRLWKALMAQQRREGITIRCGLELLPFKVPRCEFVDQARQQVWQSAWTDRELAEIAGAASAAGSGGWLHETVERDLTSATAGQIARAVAVAGFMHSGPEADALWSGPLKEAPAEGWLARVYAHARREFERHRSAVHWLDLLVGSQSPEEATSALLLLSNCGDPRTTRQGQERLRAEYHNLHPWVLRLWNQDIKSEEARRSRIEDARKNAFCSTRIAPDLSPWS